MSDQPSTSKTVKFVAPKKAPRKRLAKGAISGDGANRRNKIQMSEAQAESPTTPSKLEAYEQAAGKIGQVIRTKSLRLLWPHQMMIVNELTTRRSNPTQWVLGNAINNCSQLRATIDFLSAQTGVGKTSAVLDFVLRLGSRCRVLVIVPSIILNKWLAEIQDIQNDTLTWAVIRGENAAAVEAAKGATRILASANAIKQGMQLGRFDTIVIDEIDNSQCTKLKDWLFTCNHALLVSATMRTERWGNFHWAPRMAHDGLQPSCIMLPSLISFGQVERIEHYYQAQVFTGLNSMITSHDLTCLNLSSGAAFLAISAEIKNRLVAKRIELDEHAEQLRQRGRDDPRLELYCEARARQALELRQELLHVLERFAENLREGQCGICLEQMPASRLSLQCCQKMICIDCFPALQKSSTVCPYCRSALKETIEFYKTYLGQVANEQAPQTLGKSLTQLVTKLASDPTKKILVFMDHESWQQSSRDPCIRSRIVRGNRGVIGQMFLQFRLPDHDPTALNVLYFCQTTSFAGVDLENATDVVLSHEMEQHNEDQAIGRALRMNRTIGALTVHKFIQQPCP